MGYSSLMPEVDWPACGVWDLGNTKRLAKERKKERKKVSLAIMGRCGIMIRPYMGVLGIIARDEIHCFNK